LVVGPGGRGFESRRSPSACCEPPHAFVIGPGPCGALSLALFRGLFGSRALRVSDSSLTLNAIPKPPPRTLLSMGIALNDEVRRLLDGRHFAVLATINPDGGPQTSAMWVARDGDDVLFSTVAGRRKHRNLERDPRASVTVIDSQDPYNYVELRGRVTQIEEDVGRAFDTGLSWKYDGRDPDPDRPGAVRLILRVSVEKATGYAA
jgi:PPOX class probable F420-dependent enzyme